MNKKLNNKFAKNFFLILFLGFLGSTIFFNHTHISDGQIIVHSHPFKAGPDGKPLHEHNDTSYSLIHLLNNFYAIVATGIILSHIIYFLSREILSGPENNISFSLYKAPLLLRGPPSGMLA